MTTKQIPIWIDCDTGTDDTVAIMLAHALPELQIIGLSAVAGNSLLCNTFPNTRRVVHLLGADYPVYPGAERPLVREPHVAGAFHSIHVDARKNRVEFAQRPGEGCASGHESSPIRSRLRS